MILVVGVDPLTSKSILQVPWCRWLRNSRLLQRVALRDEPKAFPPQNFYLGFSIPSSLLLVTKSLQVAKDFALLYLERQFWPIFREGCVTWHVPSVRCRDRRWVIDRRCPLDTNSTLRGTSVFSHGAKKIKRLSGDINVAWWAVLRYNRPSFVRTLFRVALLNPLYTPHYTSTLKRGRILYGLCSKSRVTHNLS